eukprot:4584290-Alexandrium_andersonii.AAC.1
MPTQCAGRFRVLHLRMYGLPLGSHGQRHRAAASPSAARVPTVVCEAAWPAVRDTAPRCCPLTKP